MIMKAPDKLTSNIHSLTLTPMQHEVCSMLREGFSLSETARRLRISESTPDACRLELLHRFDLHSTVELRKLTVALLPHCAPRASAAPMIRHETSLLPNALLNPHGAFSAACRAGFDGRTLREVADYVRDCDSVPGPASDAFPGVITQHTGTIGVKQALLAALAAENERNDVQLMVACCEMEVPYGDNEHLELAGQRRQKFPLAVCWLRYKGRRLQIVEAQQASLQTVEVVTEMSVRPEHLAAERIRLYQTFAADWCRALETGPNEFARLRALLLTMSAGTSIFEDLLGYALPSGYIPAL
jgi:DNA-binding CsgD family transcriptional regulator